MRRGEERKRRRSSKGEMRDERRVKMRGVDQEEERRREIGVFLDVHFPDSPQSLAQTGRVTAATAI